MRFIHFICFVVLFSWVNSSFAQLNDSLRVVNTDTQQIIEVQPSEHSPKKATILSACIPGAGQIYNKKNWVWKVPIIYAGLGVSVYAGIFNRTEYVFWRDQYRMKVDGDSLTNGEYTDQSDSYLKSQRDYYRQNMEMSFVVTGLIYVLQILDANVEAHLLDFDVSDDLSLHVQPTTFMSQGPYGVKFPTTGMSFCLNLKHNGR